MRQLVKLVGASLCVCLFASVSCSGDSKSPAAPSTSVSATLTVTVAGTGTGTVTSNPAGVSCPSDCTASYDTGAAVTLTAAADSDSTFAGWSGDCSGSAETASVTMAAARSCTATFDEQFTLTVTVAGTGTGTVTSSPGDISCPSDCTASYDTGTAVTLTAAEDIGMTFSVWGGDCSGSAETASVTMSTSRSCTATFDDPSLYAVFAVTIYPNESDLELIEGRVLLDGSTVFDQDCSVSSGCFDDTTALHMTNEDDPTSINAGDHTLGVEIMKHEATGAGACVICSFAYSEVSVMILDSTGDTVQEIYLPYKTKAIEPGDDVVYWPFTVD